MYEYSVLSLPSATVKIQWWDKNRLLNVKLKIVALEKTSIENSLEFLFVKPLGCRVNDSAETVWRRPRDTAGDLRQFCL